jgi:hypothetical protein
MESKYYTPTIEEFHFGFEYERCDGGYEYFKDTFPRAVDISKLESYLPYFRVKCLDAKDIESLGFIKRGKTWAGYIDYKYTELIDGKVPYYLRATIHVPIMDDMYKIILHRILEEGTNIDKAVEQGESELMFRGRIKNKSELKTIMKQVGIL